MFCYPFELIAKTRKEANSIGARYYYTGKPCKRGHFSRRHRRGSCMECERIRSALYKMKNPDVVKRHNQEGWQRKKDRFWGDEEYRAQARHQEKMKRRRHRADPEKSDDLREKNTAQKKAEYHRRIKTDERFIWTVACRRMINRCVSRGHNKSRSMVEELGYSPDEFMEHISAQFCEGMSWLNHGEWQIDHIRPLCTFPVGAPISEANALSNLRPLWAIENNQRPRTWEE